MMKQTQEQSKVLNRDWVAYYQAAAGRMPRKTLLLALESFEGEMKADNSRFAVDLGCGDGRDTVELLRRGWQVLGIDKQPEALSRLRSRPDIDATLLETRIMHFEALQLPPDVDLINASFSLPLCSPEAFPNLWAKIVAALRTGGYFCGHLFGERDSWANDPYITHCTRDRVLELLQPFAIQLLEEEEHPGKTPLGEDRNWHIFHLVARKR